MAIMEAKENRKRRQPCESNGLRTCKDGYSLPGSMANKDALTGRVTENKSSNYPSVL